MSFNRRLQVDVIGNVSGFLAALNQANLGTTRFAQGLRQGQKEAGLFQKQLLAIGTTARYALAGQMVFGIVGAIDRLGEFKSQLGAIDAVAGSVDRRGNFRSVGGQLNDIGRDAILMSNQIGIAATDVEAYMQRFYSSFHPSGGPAARLAAMEAFVKRAAMLQRQFGAEAGDPQMLAGGIAGLVQNIPGGTRNVPAATKRVANLISNLVATTPNITGRDVARDIGRVGSTMNIARMTPEQAFAVWGVAGMSGGSSSVIGRGVTQLLSASLLNPKSPAQQQAFAQAGLPTDPTMLRNMGGWKVLMQLLKFAQGQGINVVNPKALLNEDLSDEEAAQAAVGGKVNLTGIYNMFGRQESVRQFVNLLGQGGPKAMQNWIDNQNKAVAADQQRQRYEASVRQATLQRFTQARQNLSMGLVGAASWPLENLIARPTIRVSDEVARHRQATQVAMGTALTLGAASQLRKLGAFQAGGRFGALGKIFGGYNRLQTGAISQAISKEELPAAISGQHADGTRAAPFWVIISPLSQAVGGIPQGGFGGGGDGPDLPGGKGGGGKPGSKSRFFEQIKGWLGLGGVGGAGAAGAGLRGVGLKAALGTGALAAVAAADVAALYRSAGGGYQGEAGHLAFGASRDARGKMIIDYSKVHGATYSQMGIPQLAAPVFAAMKAAKVAEPSRVEVTGQTETDMTIKLVDKDGRTIIVQEQKGVPTKLWTTTAPPSSKGKHKSRKGR